MKQQKTRDETKTRMRQSTDNNMQSAELLQYAPAKNASYIEGE